MKLKEFFYTLNAKDKYSDFDSRKSFNRINKPDFRTSLLGSLQNGSTASLTAQLNSEGVHEVRLAWRHIKKWLHKHCEDINDSLLEACTDADIHELEKDLGCQLPACMVEFLHMTGGQSSLNDNGCSGLFFGLKLCSIDEIAVLTERWRCVHDELKRANFAKLMSKNYGVYDTPKTRMSVTLRGNLKLLFPEQSSIPPNSILPVYAHSMWIPFVSDRAGNYIAVDLSADSDSEQQSVGRWGQIILFGRDFDTKFKIANNFGDFLLIFANDLELGNWALREFGEIEDVVCGVESELVYRDKKTQREVPYLDVLRTKSMERWLESLSEEERTENVSILEQLEKKYSYEVPAFKFNTDSLITANLRQMDLINDFAKPTSRVRESLTREADPSARGDKVSEAPTTDSKD